MYVAHPVPPLRENGGDLRTPDRRQCILSGEREAERDSVNKDITATDGTTVRGIRRREDHGRGRTGPSGIN